jgi:hypothetical protein
MAKIVREDLWETEPNTIILVTTNSVSTGSGLVMGKGSALEAKQLFSNIEKIISFKLRVEGLKLDGTEFYGVRIIYQPTQGRLGLGILQTKRHWHNDALMHDVVMSLNQLRRIAYDNPKIEYRTVLPGTGLGHLPVNQIAAICKSLPDNVTFCRK